MTALTLSPQLQIINLFDTALNVPYGKIAKKTLTVLGIIVMGLLLAALILTVLATKLSLPIIKEMRIYAVSKSKLAKQSLPPAKGMTGKTITVKVTATESTPIATESTPIAPESTMEYLQTVAKTHKVKGWNFFKTPESLAKKLDSLGIDY